MHSSRIFVPYTIRATALKLQFECMFQYLHSRESCLHIPTKYLIPQFIMYAQISHLPHWYSNDRRATQPIVSLAFHICVVRVPMPIGIGPIRLVVNPGSLVELLYDEQVDLRSTLVQESQHIIREASVLGLSSERICHGVMFMLAVVGNFATARVKHAQDTKFIVFACADSYLSVNNRMRIQSHCW